MLRSSRLSSAIAVVVLGYGCANSPSAVAPDASVVSNGGGPGGTTVLGGTSGSGGAGGAGGGVPRTCTGTPTTTCASATCDQVTGCTVTTPGCTGTPTPCSSYDNQTTCSSQQGCTSNPSAGLCYQYHTSCDYGYNNPNNCKAIGCNYNSGACTGTVTNCASAYTESSCDNAAACRWQAADKNYCTGIAKTCATVSRATCASQAGCSVATPACTGEPTPCGDLSLAACTSQPGCVLSGSGGVGGSGGTGGTGGTGGMVKMPDLVITKFNVSEEVRSGADSLLVSVTASNRGNAAAPAHKEALIVSPDNIIGNADDIVAMEFPSDFVMDPFGFTSSQLGPSYLAKSTLAALVPSGYYYVGWLVDSKNEVVESEETNNTRLGPKVFIGTPIYDIKVAAVSWDAISPIAPGTPTTVSVTVVNGGNYPIASYTVSALLSTDAAVAADDLRFCSTIAQASLDVGAQTTVTLTCKTPRARGAFLLGAEATLAATITDANPANNWLLTAEPFTFAAPSPDLTVTSVETLTTSAKWASEVTFLADVVNPGIDPAGTFEVGFYLSTDLVLDAKDTLICKVPVTGGLAAAATTHLFQACTLPKTVWGSYRVIAKADDADVLFETDETNNTGLALGAVTVETPSWDLFLDFFSSDAIFTVTVGQTINFKADVKNLGTDTVPGFEIEARMGTGATVGASDTLMCSATMPELPSQATAHVTFSCAVPSVAAGTYHFAVIVDPRNQLPELDETNNSYTDATTSHPVK